MDALAQASLAPNERRALERLVALLEEELGDELRGVWLYGSRARGEAPKEDSDIDLLVVSAGRRPNDDLRAIELAFAAADAEGLNPLAFSVKLFDRDYVEDRRSIRSFFMQEVDRDKIVLAGTA